MNTKSIFTALTIALVPAAALTPSAYAAEDPVYTGLFSNLAVQGYDPVAYFTVGEPVQGRREFTTEYMGANFRFASQENLDLFLADPEAYAPQYGGYCAWAVSQGYTAKGDANHWAIVDDRLYLNYNADVQSDWNEDREAFISTADENWPNVLN